MSFSDMPDAYIFLYSTSNPFNCTSTTTAVCISRNECMSHGVSVRNAIHDTQTEPAVFHSALEIESSPCQGYYCKPVTMKSCNMDAVTSIETQKRSRGH